jgi:hypothetical protein
LQVAHVVGHYKQDSGQRAQRNLPSERRKKEQGGYQREAMGDAGYRVGAAIADIGGGAGDRPGGCKKKNPRIS